jgi:Na+-transporting methylmalonyl-CoA/oxaloacetate decarboxylase gamma subunit
MRKVFIFMMIGAFVMAMGIGASAQEKKGEATTAEKAAPAAQKPKVVREKTTTVTATVEAIDLAKRVVTLKGAKGNLFDLKVGEQAKNLSQVKVGDEVVAKYYQSIAARVKKPGEAGGATSTQAVETAKPGETPGGMVANMVTVTATVEDISPKKTYVSLKAPDGKIYDVKVKDPKNLENVKVGDKVEITYTEALAISVEKRKKK